jgi:ParG
MCIRDNARKHLIVWECCDATTHNNHYVKCVARGPICLQVDRRCSSAAFQAYPAGAGVLDSIDPGTTPAARIWVPMYPIPASLQKTPKKNFPKKLKYHLRHRSLLRTVRHMTPEKNSETKSSDRRVRVNLKLNASTHARIKVWCARRGTSMQSALESILDNAFEKVDT